MDAVGTGWRARSHSPGLEEAPFATPERAVQCVAKAFPVAKSSLHLTPSISALLGIILDPLRSPQHAPPFWWLASPQARCPEPLLLGCLETFVVCCPERVERLWSIHISSARDSSPGISWPSAKCQDVQPRHLVPRSASSESSTGTTASGRP